MILFDCSTLRQFFLIYRIPTDGGAMVNYLADVVVDSSVKNFNSYALDRNATHYNVSYV